VLRAPTFAQVPAAWGLAGGKPVLPELGGGTVEDFLNRINVRIARAGSCAPRLLPAKSGPFVVAGGGPAGSFEEKSRGFVCLNVALCLASFTLSNVSAGVAAMGDGENLTASGIRALALAIVGGEFAAGARLTTDDVMAKLRVSRPTAREIVQFLQSKGLVRTKTRLGAVVRPPREWAVLDPDVIDWRLRADYAAQIRSLTELRAAVEPHAARLAAERATPEQRTELRLVTDRLVALGLQPDTGAEFERDAFLDCDRRYHRLILDGAQNEMLRAHSHAIEAGLKERLDRAAKDATIRSDVIQPFPWAGPRPIAMHLHDALRHAVIQGAPGAAATFSRGILSEIQGRIRNTELVRDVLAACDEITLPEKTADVLTGFLTLTA
jgi:DNA-binding FadR family transcriptional regulator